MAALGLGIGMSGSTWGGGSTTAVVIEDYFWELDGAGSLKPLASGTVSDFHDTWDLDGTDYTPQTTTSVSDEGYWDLDGTDYKPATVITVKDEGYWDVHTISSGNDGIKPLDIT